MQLRIDRERVDALMKTRGIVSYRQLAVMAELHHNTIDKALRGDNWNSETAAKLAKALKCNPIDLQVAEGYPKPFLVAPASH